MYFHVQVRWRYQADTGLWETYEDEQNALIERAYRKKHKSITLDLVSGKVKIDFEKKVEIDLTGQKPEITIHRVDKEAGKVFFAGFLS